MCGRISAGHDWRLLGYADQLSVRPGETIRFMVSSELDYDARLVRLRDRARPGGGWEDAVPSVADGTYRARQQHIRLGSFGYLPRHPHRRLDADFTLQFWVLSTTPSHGRPQVVVSMPGQRGGWQIAIDAQGCLGVSIGGPTDRLLTAIRRPLQAGEWYFVVLRHDSAANRLTLDCVPRSPWIERASVTAGDLSLSNTDGSLLIAAGGSASAPECFFNGKISNPAGWTRALAMDELDQLRAGAPAIRIDQDALRFALDFAAEPESMRLIDHSPAQLHGVAVNGPLRAVTGPAWTGAVLNFGLAPEQYDAIHFHEDDLDDARWEPDIELAVGQWPSGVYAMRLDAGGHVDHVPFVVLPGEAARADTTVVLPTFTYTAYANMRCLEPMAAELAGSEPTSITLSPRERQIASLPDLGLSLYDLHADGSICSHSTRRRPILDMRPDYRYALTGGPRHFAQDLGLIGWLERRGERYNVITDEQLSSDPDALRGTRVVVTGSHPEYVSGSLRDSLARHVGHGGRLMYLGGNGYYWVAAAYAERPYLLEVRRGYAGTRPGTSAPGEAHLAATGEPGGLWRFRGQAPQHLVTVGFSAQGWRNGTGYRRLPDAQDPAAAFVFDGIESDLIGDGGPFGGAAGDEIDRVDRALGSPEQTLVLATSQGRHGAEYQIPSEEARVILPEQCNHNPNVRADIALTEMPGGGRVFAVGSIAWTLHLIDMSGSVARTTANVLDSFLDTDEACRAESGPKEPDARQLD